jgi:thioredoxin-like negative regulator of GroEL
VAQRFKIEKTPTFIVYKNGVKVIRVDGAPKEKADLAKWVENLINFTSY